MNDDRRELTESKVKDILEKVPMTKRLGKSEKTEMKEDFLKAVREDSQRRSRVASRHGSRRNQWFGFGAVFATCALVLFFVLTPDQKSRQETPNHGDTSGTVDYLHFGEADGRVESATDELEQSTGEVKSATQFQLNKISPESLCGPRSIWVAAAKVGVRLDLGAVAQACRLTEKGCSFWDLKKAAETFGFQVNGQQTTWEHLRRNESPVIALVRGNHFFCIDPREKSDNGFLRLYDPPNPARWISEGELDEIWNGECLSLEYPETVLSEGPRIQFESLLHDSGKVFDKNSVVGVYRCQNIGTEPLEILGVDHSCGCIRADITQTILAPGEETEVVAELALEGLDGPQVQMLDVRTNDPENGNVTLVLQAYSQRSLVLSNDTINFGVVSPSAPGQKIISVEDKSETPCVKLDAHVSWKDDARPNLRVTPSVEREGKTSRVFSVKIDASATPDTPPGTYEGQVEVIADSSEGKKATVPFQVTVASDYILSPPHVSFGVVQAGEQVKKSVQVKRRSNQSIRLVDHDVEYESGSCSLLTHHSNGSFRSIPIDLSLSVPEASGSDTQLAKGVLVFQPIKGPQVKVPWSAIIKDGR